MLDYQALRLLRELEAAVSYVEDRMKNEQVHECCLGWYIFVCARYEKCTNLRVLFRVAHYEKCTGPPVLLRVACVRTQ